ncbi:MAG: SMC-Scp complex subunit ScpB [Chloroflexota bacterium]
MTLTLEPIEITPSLASGVVALLFAADEPLSVEQLAAALEVSQREVEQAVAELMEFPPAGLLLQQHEHRLQLVTAPAWSSAVARLRAGPPVKLSRATLEVLAIVAYRQPVTRADIDQLRGVNSDRAVALLVAHGLIEEVARRDTVGRPVLFGSTLQLLELMGLSSLTDLPALSELAGLEPGSGEEALRKTVVTG